MREIGRWLIVFFTTLFLFGCGKGVPSSEEKSQIPEVKGPWGNETEYPITDTKMSNAGGSFVWLDDDNLLFVGRKTRQFISFEEDERQGASLYVWNQKNREAYSIMDFEWEKRPGKFCYYEDGKLVVRIYVEGNNFLRRSDNYKYHKVTFQKKSDKYNILEIENLNYNEEDSFVRCGPGLSLAKKGDSEAAGKVYLEKIGGMVDWSTDNPVYINKNGTTFSIIAMSSREDFQYVPWAGGYFYAKNIRLDSPSKGLVAYNFFYDGTIKENRYSYLSALQGGPRTGYLTKGGIVFQSNEIRPISKKDKSGGLYVLSQDEIIYRLILGITGTFQSTSVSPNGCYLAFSHYPKWKNMDTGWHMLDDESVKIVNFCKD